MYGAGALVEAVSRCGKTALDFVVERSNLLTDAESSGVATQSLAALKRDYVNKLTALGVNVELFDATYPGLRIFDSGETGERMLGELAARFAFSQWKRVAYLALGFKGHPGCQTEFQVNLQPSGQLFPVPYLPGNAVSMNSFWNLVVSNCFSPHFRTRRSIPWVPGLPSPGATLRLTSTAKIAFARWPNSRDPTDLLKRLIYGVPNRQPRRSASKNHGRFDRGA